MRRKTTPVPAGAGRIRSLTGAPLCRPTPEHSTAFRIVCSNAKLAWGLSPYFKGDLVSDDVAKKPQAMAGRTQAHVPFVLADNTTMGITTDISLSMQTVW